MVLPLQIPLPTLARLGALKASFLGLFASTYLLYAYVANQPIVCGQSSGCELVRLSRYAYVFETIPRPLLGVLFYAVIMLLLLLRATIRTRQVALFRLMQALVVVGVIESVWLFFVQWQDIGAFCLWCLLSAVASVALFVTIFLDRPVQDDAEGRVLELRLMLGTLGIGSMLFFAGLWFFL